MSKILKTTTLGAILLFGMTGARDAEDWTISAPPPGTVAIPAVVARDVPTDGDQVKVCMQAGVPPQTYPVISRTCWGEASTCTVFVGVDSHDSIRLKEYDAANPPVVVTTDAICTQPSHSQTGVLGRAAPRG